MQRQPARAEGQRQTPGAGSILPHEPTAKAESRQESCSVVLLLVQTFHGEDAEGFGVMLGAGDAPAQGFPHAAQQTPVHPRQRWESRQLHPGEGSMFRSKSTKQVLDTNSFSQIKKGNTMVK